MTNEFTFVFTWESQVWDPLFTFSFRDVTFGFYMFAFQHWIELVLILILESLLAAVFAFMIYKFILEPKKVNTTFAYLVGYGFIVPFWIALPIYALPLIGFRNVFYRFALGGIVPTVALFHTTEAIHGFVPDCQQKTAQKYILYFASTMALQMDKVGNHIPANFSDLIMHLWIFVKYLIIMSCYQSWLMHGENNQYLSPIFDAPQTTEEWFDPWRILSPKQWVINLGYAVLFQIALSLYGEGLKLITCLLTGKKVGPMMDNPIFACNSPSDFWGRRWNLVIHKSLKQGAYKPIRSLTNSHYMAVLLVFFLSGVFHEWHLIFIYSPNPKQLNENGECVIGSCHQHLHGGVLAFFLWQSLLVVAEIILGPTKILQRITAVLPPIVRSLCVVALGLPLAHWFVEPYARSDFFLHEQYGLFSIQQIII